MKQPMMKERVSEWNRTKANLLLSPGQVEQLSLALQPNKSHYYEASYRIKGKQERQYCRITKSICMVMSQAKRMKEKGFVDIRVEAFGRFDEHIKFLKVY